ncbi:MAG: DNA mismatch repair protein MutS [bacterium]|nr:DNA mismatch repair protein MutS [bacterium]
MRKLSPMMAQYKQIKEKNKDSVLFFRLGDFYEMFYEDAEIASRELELVLTGKDCGQNERAPMCGIPYHSCEAYISRLIQKGYKIAICEQVEDPATAKGIVKREVVRVITPGTIMEDSMLDESRNNYLASVCFFNDTCGVCFIDASTGDINVSQTFGKDILQWSQGEIGKFIPREILLCSGQKLGLDIKRYCDQRFNTSVVFINDDYSDLNIINSALNKQFGSEYISKIGLDTGCAAAGALAMAIDYLKKTQMNQLDRIKRINIYEDSQFMKLDLTAIRNLELVASMRTGEKRGSLLWVLDKTKTAMGRRLIRKWIGQPLTDIFQIETRYDAIEELSKGSFERGELRELLLGVHDIERLMTRIVYSTAGARELRSLAFAISKLPEIKRQLGAFHSKLLSTGFEKIDLLEDVLQLIDEAIVEDPPFSVKEGGIIKPGFNHEVDLLRGDMNDGKGVIAKVEAQEKERTGIKSLKVRYNKVFGYYIEVTNSYLNLVPPEYIRKQTLTNCERYITEELKILESRVLGSKEKSIQLEFAIFEQIRTKISQQLDRIQSTAEIIALIDVLCALAEVAVRNNYCRPVLNLEGRINIVNGRHPVVEQMNSQPFVANDTCLDGGDNRCAIITGPNMAGKSTYMRQTALIVLMAQIGSFVPAQRAEICMVDALFTRVGASDDLSTGRSTFMVEMSEIAYILKNATKNSLLILDEIGRGTSTYDGMAIARAVLEHVSNLKSIGAKTLFATHYHELTVLEGVLDGVKNYNVAVKKRGEDITFLRRIVRGGADDSYGIEVAKLSGVSDSVIKRAREILQSLETGENQVMVTNKQDTTEQLGLINEIDSSILDELRGIDVNTLTPIEAMSVLFDFVNKAKNI